MSKNTGSTILDARQRAVLDHTPNIKDASDIESSIEALSNLELELRQKREFLSEQKRILSTRLKDARDLQARASKNTINDILDDNASSEDTDIFYDILRAGFLEVDGIEQSYVEVIRDNT